VLFQVLNLLGAHVTAFSHQDRPDVLAMALRTMQLWDQIDWKHALLSPELASDALEIHILIKSAFETKRVDAKAGIHHRANRNMPGWVKLLSQRQVTLMGFCRM
jgi:hypothetical protein